MSWTMLVAADALGAAYLLAWARRRERRNRAAVTVVGLLLAACSVSLVLIGGWAATAPHGPLSPPPAPSVPTGPAVAT